MQENVQSALKSQMDMFEEFDAGTQISTENLLANMQSQVDGVTAWEQNLSALADRGINQGILQKLSEMGPQGSGYVAAFNSMTDEELKKANDLWSQSVDIQGMTNEWGQQLLTYICYAGKWDKYRDGIGSGNAECTGKSKCCW